MDRGGKSFFLLLCAHLIVVLALLKLLAFIKSSKKNLFFLHLCSHNRNFAADFVLLAADDSDSVA